MSVRRLGFTELSGSGSARRGPYRVNIIFVHGLRGHPKNTWEASREDLPTATPSKRKTFIKSIFKKSTSTNNEAEGSVSRTLFWPDEYLPEDIPEARVWTYGYNADVIGGLFQANNQNSVSQHGRDLAVKLEREIENEDPILFVVHSLGGIITKDALCRSDTCRSRTKLIVFLGTPHRGSEVAGWGQVASNLANLALQDSNKKMIDTLEVNSEVLDNIHEQFKKIAPESGIMFHSFQEGRGIAGIKGLHYKVVGDYSSKLDLPFEVVESLDANHMQLARCSHKEDPRYRAILGVLKKFMRIGVLESDTRYKEISSITSRAQTKVRAAAELGGVPTNRCHYYIPLPVNIHFIGRQTTLDTLRDILFTQESQKVAVVGLGGVGKTQVALQVAYWAKKNKPEYSIFWLPALSDESFKQACTEIVRKFTIEKTTDDEDQRETVRRHLSSETAGKWLLIVDNADDAGLLFGCSDKPGGISRYLPNNEEGITLFTTRSREIAVSVARSDVVDLDEMEPQEAKKLWWELLIPKDLLRDEALTTKLLRELTYLPLAITQAAAYINIKKVPIAEYLELLHGTEQDIVGLMSKEFPDNTRYSGSKNAVATTWLVSFNQIHKSEKVAAELLSFISCIEPRGIPQSILPSSEPKQQLVDAIGTLCAYSFLSRRGDSKIFDMHSLVHLASRIWIQSEDRTASTILKAIRHLEAIFPTDDHANRELWREYLPHVFRILQQKGGLDIVEKSELDFWVGRCLIVDGRIKEAVRHLGESCKWRNSHFAEDHPSRLASQHALAGAYEANGQIKEAVKLLEHVVAIQGETLAGDNPSRLASQHALAGAYRANGQIKEAVKLLEHVVAIQGETLAEDHPDRLASQHELARAYRANGQIKEAVKLLEHVVAIRGETLAEDHPSRLASQHALAGAYRANGQIKEAVKLLEHVVAIQGETLAEDHPDRLASQHELTGAYGANGQIKEAVKLLEHVVAIREETLAEDHPSRLASQHELARAYRANGQIKEAVKLLEHVVAIQGETLAEDHPDRLASQHALAGAYRANGQIKEAVKLLEHVVAVEGESLAEDHPSRLASQHALAGAYRANGQIKEAVKLLEHVVAIREETLAEDHPSRLASQHELAGAYRANGQIKEAVKLLEHVVAIQGETLAEDHPDRLASQHALAGAYRANGQIKEAVKLLEHVVAVEGESLAEDHPSRLASQHALAGAYRANGQIKEAVKLLEHVVAIREETLAEDHPSRLASQHELARAYRANGQIKEAVKLLEHVVAVKGETLAEDHPSRLASQHALAGAYRANGQIKEAVKLLEHVVAIREETLAEDHPDRLASQHALVGAYRANGQIKEAVKLLEHVVAIQGETLAEDHPDRLASQHALVGAYRANEQIKEAVKLLL